MIYIRKLDPNKIKIDEKSYKNMLTYYIRYMTIKNLIYVTIDVVNSSYLIIHKINEYIEENNSDKYLTLVPTDESKEN